MTTMTLAHEAARPARPSPAPIPLRRIAAVELRKSFDTRSGFWLMASVGIAALLATASVIAFAPESELTYDTSPPWSASRWR